MADPIIVEIGAKIDKLVEAVEQSKAKLHEIEEHASAISEGFEKISERVKEAFEIGTIVEFVRHFAELGENMERMMTILGLNAEGMVQLSAMAKLSNTSIDALALSLERMYLNIQRATHDAFSPAAQGLQVLGLRAKDFIGIPTTEYVERLHQAVMQFNPSLNLTTALMAVGGRNFAQMIPLLHMSAEEWEKNKVAIKAATDGWAAAVPGMAGTNQEIDKLMLALTSLGARIFTVLKPGIDLVIKAMRDWVQSIDQEKIKATVAAVGNFTLQILEAVGHFAITVGEIVDGVLTKLDALKTAMSPSNIPGVAILNNLAAIFKPTPVGEGDGVGAQAQKEVDKFTKAHAAFQAIINKWKETFKDWQEHLGTGEHPAEAGGKEAAPMPAGKSAVEAAASVIEQQLAMEKGRLDRMKLGYEADAAAFRMTALSKVMATADVNIQIAQAEESAATARRNLWAKGSHEWEAEEKKRVTAHEKVMTAIKTKEVDTTKAIASEWTKVGDIIASSVTSQFRGLLEGTMTWHDAAMKALEDIIIKFLELIAKAIILNAVVAAGEAMGVPVGQVLSVLKLQHGTDYVPQTQLALVHQGEMVIPSGAADMIRSGQAGMGGGNTQVTIGITAWDGSSVNQWLKGGGDRTIAQAVSKAYNLNPNLRASY